MQRQKAKDAYGKHQMSSTARVSTRTRRRQVHVSRIHSLRNGSSMLREINKTQTKTWTKKEKEKLEHRKPEQQNNWTKREWQGRMNERASRRREEVVQWRYLGRWKRTEVEAPWEAKYALPLLRSAPSLATLHLSKDVAFSCLFSLNLLLLLYGHFQQTATFVVHRMSWRLAEESCTLSLLSYSLPCKCPS